MNVFENISEKNSLRVGLYFTDISYIKTRFWRRGIQGGERASEQRARSIIFMDRYTLHNLDIRKLYYYGISHNHRPFTRAPYHLCKRNHFGKRDYSLRTKCRLARRIRCTVVDTLNTLLFIYDCRHQPLQLISRIKPLLGLLIVLEKYHKSFAFDACLLHPSRFPPSNVRVRRINFSSARIHVI